MMMKFYDALQLDPAILKRKIADCGGRRQKAYYWAAMALRSVLIVAFAGGSSAPYPPCSAPITPLWRWRCSVFC